MRRRRLIELLVVRWGFAAMVAVAIVVGFVAGATAATPVDIPAVALGAASVYRVEVGAAVFLGLYLAAVALVLAMHNRAFTELGTGGVRAQDLATISEGVATEGATTEVLMDLTEEFNKLRGFQKESRIGD